MSQIAVKPADGADHLYSLIDCLPLEHVEYAFAYGSGAVAQKGEDVAGKMVDFIVVTKDTDKFHAENRKQNPRHYSAVRFLGANKLSQLQRYFGAAVYYNTRVRSKERLIKYGIIDSKDLQEDLLEWKYLYIAGRMHKPIVSVTKPWDVMKANIEENRRSALQVAMLQLPESFSLTELLQKIVRISYDGDFRQSFGEDKRKVEKIVSGAYHDFQEIYEPMLRQDSRVYATAKEGRFEHDVSTPAIYHRLNLLPANVLEGLRRVYGSRSRDPRHRDVEEMLFRMSHRHDVTEETTAVVRRIVARSALTQTAKNAVTAGFVKGLVYAADKVLKMFRSMR